MARAPGQEQWQRLEVRGGDVRGRPQSQPIAVGDGARSLMATEDPSEEVVEDDAIKSTTEGDASKPTVEYDADKPAAEDDASKPATEDDASKSAD